jgi:acetolactate synthase-1/2/3 large subunit
MLVPFIRTEQSMTGGEILVECLKAQGVRDIAGMPGNQNIWIYDAILQRGGINHRLIRNEQGATLIANGYARASGDVGVALTVPGPGSTNASTGIVDAHTDSVPILLVTGGTEVSFDGRDRSKCFHGLDQAAFFAPITRAFERPLSVGEIPDAVTRVFEAMRSPRPGPTVLELPVDVASAEGDADIPGRVESPIDEPEVVALSKAAETIATFDRPVIIAGKNVIEADACDHLRELAEKLGAPVTLTRLGKGALSDRHLLNVGHCSGKAAREIYDEADGLIAIGCRFTQIDTRSWSLPFPDRCVQFDPDPAELGRERDIECGVAGHLARSLAELVPRVRPVDSAWSERSGKIRSDVANARPPLELLAHVRDHVDDDAIFVVDVTSVGYRTFDELPIYGPRDFLYPSHSVTLGFALPAAIGAKIACPDRQVVAVCGDGGYAMTSFELGTAVEHTLDLTVIVSNDGSLSAIRGAQAKAFDGRVIGTDMHVPRIADAATATGARGIRVDDPERFGAVFDDTLGLEGPTVIEVMLQEQRDAIIERVPWLNPD